MTIDPTPVSLCGTQRVARRHHTVAAGGQEQLPSPPERVSIDEGPQGAGEGSKQRAADDGALGNGVEGVPGCAAEGGAGQRDEGARRGTNVVAKEGAAEGREEEAEGGHAEIKRGGWRRR